MATYEQRMLLEVTAEILPIRCSYHSYLFQVYSTTHWTRVSLVAGPEEQEQVLSKEHLGKDGQAGV